MRHTDPGDQTGTVVDSTDPEQGGLFDLDEGRARRDAGIAKVEGSLADQLTDLLTARVGQEVTGEDIRVLSGIEAQHPNAWGAAIMTLARRGNLQKTGEYRQMQRPSAHARVNPVYLIVG